MKTKTLFLAIFILILLSFSNRINAQSVSANAVRIGNQVWASVNLDVTSFRNGDPIEEAESDSAWNKATEDSKPAWCYNKVDSVNGKICGKLYNWYAVNDPRGLAPKGWHIPTREEWIILLFDKGTERDANNYKSSTGWKTDPEGHDSTGNGNNSTGLSVYPGGYRDYDATSFQRTGEYGFFWTASHYDDSSACDWHFSNVGTQTGNGNYAKGCGLSVRCIKD